jgi:hypothetical protein
MTKRFSPLAALLLVTVAMPAFAASSTGPTRAFTGADLFDLEVATDPQISPDGTQIVYARESNDIMTDRSRKT